MQCYGIGEQSVEGMKLNQQRLPVGCSLVLHFILTPFLQDGVTQIPMIGRILMITSLFFPVVVERQAK